MKWQAAHHSLVAVTAMAALWLTSTGRQLLIDLNDVALPTDNVDVSS